MSANENLAPPTLDQALRETARMATASVFLGTEIAWRLVDVLVAKGVLNKSEARGTLYALADGIRRDAHGAPSSEATEMVARTLEQTADKVWPRGQAS